VDKDKKALFLVYAFFGVSALWIGWSYLSSEHTQRYTLSQPVEAKKELVVKFKIDGTFMLEDEEGRELELFKVDPRDPIGDVARTKKGELKVTSGGPVLYFVSHSSPGHICTCMGNQCGCR
jgi:hypothetical protein